MRLKNCYIVKDYNKEKQIVACKICNKHTKVKNKNLKDFICCESEKWTLESEYNDYKYRAFEKKREFQLTKFEFLHLVTSNCFYCGAPPREMSNGKMRNGIDRMDNDKGYLKENVIGCCSTCNYIKGEFGIQGLRRHLKNMTKKLDEYFDEPDRDIQHSLLVESGCVDIDIKRLFVLHSKKLINLNEKKEMLANYIESIPGRDATIDYSKSILALVGRKPVIDKSDEGAKKTLSELVRIFIECLDNGKIRMDVSMMDNLQYPMRMVVIDEKRAH